MFLPSFFIARYVRILMMSPAERAREELGELARESLPSKGLYKEFYLKLTLIVRRYIERAHKIAAPKRTTDEFLREAAGREDFSPEALEKLRGFLDGADMVKFAGARATREMAEDSERDAREYLKDDASAAAALAEAERMRRKAARRGRPLFPFLRRKRKGDGDV